jgi:Ca-activated chloride channel family protein
MSFLTPSRLLLLVLVVALLGGYLVVQRQRRTYTIRFTNLALLASVAPRRPGWRRHVGAALLLGALVVLVAGFARPTWKVRVPRERASVMLALDVSLSMQATDVAPTRLEAAQQAARRFVAVFPRRFRLGLVAFSGGASVLAEPNTNRGAVLNGLGRLQLGERTAIGEGIFSSLDALRRAARLDAHGTKTDIPARIVLLSDGATNAGRSNDTAVAAALKQHVPVFTIAFGTEHGTAIVGDQSVEVPADRAALKAIADQTKGSYASATTATEVRRIYENLGSSIGYRSTAREVMGWFLGIGCGLALAAAVASLLWASRLP